MLVCGCQRRAFSPALSLPSLRPGTGLASASPMNPHISTNHSNRFVGMRMAVPDFVRVLEI